MRYSKTDAGVATRGRSKSKIFIGAVAAAALSFGVLGLSTAEASRAVQGDGVVTTLVPNPAFPGPDELPLKAGDVVNGATASIHRNAAGVSINIHTVGLNAGHAYTVWVIEVCETCGGPPVQLAGHVVGRSGVGNFSGRLGVQDPLGGEFHVVIADHGLLDPANMPDAIKTGLPPFSGPTQNWSQLAVFLG
jgi:hypothetical protein